MSKADAERFRDKRAPTNRKGDIVGPWKSDFDAMSVKTCLRKLWNLLPAGPGDAARKLQETVASEEAIEAGRSVQGTAPIELDLGVPAEPALEPTDDAVERALVGGPAAGAAGGGEPADDVQFETAEEEKARTEREAKERAAKLIETVGRAAGRAREPGDDDGEFSK
jgi:recombinational DNA repair protein RecT